MVGAGHELVPLRVVAHEDVAADVGHADHEGEDQAAEAVAPEDVLVPEGEAVRQGHRDGAEDDREPELRMGCHRKSCRK